MTLALLCPGQSAQTAQAFLAIAQEPETRQIAEAFQRVTGLTPHMLQQATPEALQANSIAQPLVCATTLATFFLLRSALPSPCVVAGYSIGELAAYGVAGWIEPFEVIRLARLRAQCMDEANRQGAICAVRGLPRSVIASILAPNSYIAIVNGADRYVLAGSPEGMAQTAEAAGTLGANVTFLPVRIASHTPLMRDAVAPFKKALESVTFQSAQTPVLAGIDGASVLSRAEAIHALSEQLATTIDWAACMIATRERGARLALELPPGGDIARLMRESEPTLRTRAVVEFRSLKSVADWIDRTA
ncbi:ACP S-malonyltransferase [Brucella intermedia]|uniref:ACP S-malonyltransferase n=1 Tax=Brucella intermedia TaxID=94625 RepID=UPI00224B95B4|nr:acyltransferase domain-containing protein [Brucella intermedia]